jgi:hypothetical protein
LQPIGAPAIKAPIDEPFLLVEAKPKTAREARLSEAEYTLSDVPLDYSDFRILESPHINATTVSIGHRRGE